MSNSPTTAQIITFHRKSSVTDINTAISTVQGWTAETSAEHLAAAVNVILAQVEDGIQAAIEFSLSDSFNDLEVAYERLLPLDGRHLAMDTQGNMLVLAPGGGVVCISLVEAWRDYLDGLGMDPLTRSQLIEVLDKRLDFEIWMSKVQADLNAHNAMVA